MNRAVVSGDIIASTSLSNDDRYKLGKCIKVLIKKLKKRYNAYCRYTEGDDYIDCYIPDISEALRVMLAIKCFIKSVPVNINHKSDPKDSRIKFFRTHGIRLALGIGELSRLDLKSGIIDGEAIYYSGRLINENRTYNKGKVIIKNTLFIKSNDKELDDEITPLLALLDILISRCTPKQSQVIYLKLMDYDESLISRALKKKQATINEHSTGAGWNAIEKAVKRFEVVMKNKQLQA